ncbi:pyocin knob domain-containing protein [Avibacterium paragallinarum]|uniref:pyocin knob domain-containing protein n=9 Tax=Avibacterium paragallinarum TaxID=728 RepID=UPI002EBBDA44|nr:pyocin knob domain-containing protein [Avibacterium paragallinarum]MEE3681687.1 pyocin knob domain-containing protein [Avibacterium paragallinarum]MEE4386689.1 pyocin knob domain-containing protein [Avibacterium paragallinarum]
MAVNQINSPPTITKVGLKLATMNNNQHLSLTITHAAFGTEKYRPTGEETSLKQERLRVGIASAVRLDEKTIQMRFVVKAEQDEGFWCNEIGFWANNTLIAVYSSDEIKGEGLIFISDKVETTISFSLALEAMPVERIDVQIMQDQDKLIQLINQHENEDNPHPQYTPKTLTATSQNAVEETGHSHEIDKASTSQAGIVQLTNATDSEAETLGLTAKAGKTLKGLIDALTRNLGNYIPNSKKSNAINSPSGDTVATSKAVNQLNELKADKATTLAGYGITDFAQRALTASDNLNDITVKGLYRNTSYLNTTNNNYPENASGVLFVLSSAEQVYFSITGKIWKRFKDTNNWANGWARVDGNAIFEEGGMIKKTLVLNETLVMKRLFAGNQAREWANYHSQQGHTFYLSEDRSKKGMSLTQEGLEVVGTLKGEDFNLGNGHSLKTLFTQIGSFSLIADLGEMNINELKFPCIAGQPRNDNARCDRGYPVEARAGSLSVMPSAYGYKQVYNTYDYGLIFTRNQTANGEWGEWRRCDSRIKDVQILTGVVQHGSTLPIPSGFSENECKFFISLNFDDPSLSGWDIQEVGAGKHYYQKCYLTGREVTAQVWHGSGRGMDVGKWIDGKANYLVIGIKEG